ncbi:MAG: hypothetical protein ACRD2O_05240 [Terriglobia bacterium]
MSHMHERELVRHISSVREFRDADITLVQGNSHKAIRRCQSTKGQRVHLVIKVTTKPVPERSRELRAELEGAPLSFTFFLVGIAVIVVTEGAAAPIVIGLEASGTIAGSLETGLKLGRVSNAIRHPTSNQWSGWMHIITSVSNSDLMPSNSAPRLRRSLNSEELFAGC